MKKSEKMAKKGRKVLLLCKETLLTTARGGLAVLSSICDSCVPEHCKVSGAGC